MISGQAIACAAAAHHRLGREIHEDGAEQRQRDADAAEDEVFPGRLDGLAACDRG